MRHSGNQVAHKATQRGVKLFPVNNTRAGNQFGLRRTNDVAQMPLLKLKLCLLVSFD